MDNQREIEMRLWNYIDGNVSAEEKKDIEELLQHNTIWKTTYIELRNMHQLILNNLELEQPSMRFTKNVMEEISKTKIAQPTKKYINRNIITGIAAFFIIVITAALIYGFTQVNWTISTNSTPIIDIGKIDVGKYLDNRFLNIAIMLIAVLGLILLDKILTAKRSKQVFH